VSTRFRLLVCFASTGVNAPETMFPSWKRTSRHFVAWCVERKIELVHIEPGKPVQNPHVESVHGRLREECLNASWFVNLFDARKKIGAWRREYNEERPHSSLGYRTPAEFAAAYAATAVASGPTTLPVARQTPEPLGRETGRGAEGDITSVSAGVGGGQDVV
jgi:Integrase core domain